MAIAAEIQNRSLTNALRSIARSAQFEAFQDRLEHFCKGYDTLLAYRNHYVHSLMGTEGGKGGLLSLSAKGTLQYCKETIETAHLVNLTNSLQQLVAYGAALQRDLGATGRGLMNLLTAYEALPETPQWPKTLQKPQRLIRAPKPPPRP